MLMMSAFGGKADTPQPLQFCTGTLLHSDKEAVEVAAPQSGRPQRKASSYLPASGAGDAKGFPFSTM